MNGILAGAAVGMILLAVGFIVFAVYGNERPIPRGGIQWAAVVLSVCIILVSGVLLALALADDHKARLAEEGVNEPAADFAFRLLESEAERRLADFEGRVVLLNFWATWCRPCITELPDLDRLQAAWRDRGLVVITVSDEAREDILLFADLLPKETESGYFDPETLPEPYRTELAKGRPISYVVDRRGIIRHYVVGAGNYDSFERLVRPLIDAEVSS